MGELVAEDSGPSEDDDLSYEEEDVPGDMIRLNEGTDFIDWTEMEGRIIDPFVQSGRVQTA